MDLRTLIAEIENDNLCNYFILPLLKINKSTFASDLNFINSYLTNDGLNIYVKVNETRFFEYRMVMHLQYQATWIDAFGMKYIQYSIPFNWQKDVQLFLDGKYSHMLSSAKEMIINWSGLQYRIRNPLSNLTVTDVRLLALERCSSLRGLLEGFYNVKLNEEDELLSKPTAKDFIDTKLLSIS